MPAHLRRAADESARLLHAAGAMLYLLDEGGVALRWAYDAGIRDADELAWVRCLRFPAGVGLFGRAVSEGRLQSTADYRTDPRFVHSPLLGRFVEDMDVRSMIVTRLLAQRMRQKKSQQEPVEPLTERELEVLSLLGKGSSNKEIATALLITERTARTHVSNILGKLGL